MLTIGFFSSIFGKKNSIRIKRIVSAALGLMHVSNEAVPLSDKNALTFHCPNDLTRWRVQTFFEKEPETLEWIDGFSENEVFWDIGANMGLYTIYAASRGCTVLAFEPSAANYYVLNASVSGSGLGDKVSAFCIALSDGNRLGKLMMQSMDFGGALSSFDSTIGFDGNEFHANFEQGMVGYSVDGFITAFEPPFPTHIKIDVDGIEDSIVAGAHKTLLDDRLKSLSVELDASRPDYTDAIIKKITGSGFILKSKRHADMFDDGPYSGIYNYCFVRVQNA
jgi:FkbM family methyltransferase